MWPLLNGRELRLSSPAIALWLPRGVVLGSALVIALLERRGAATDVALLPAAVALVLVIGLGARRPGQVLVLLLAFVPLQVALLAALYAAGAPAGIVRGLGFLKEACVAALVLAALSSRERTTRLRGPVPWALAFVLLASLAFVVALAVPGVFYDIPLGARVLGWRTNCLGLVGLLALSCLDLGAVWRTRALSTVVAIGVLMGLGALWNGLLPLSFDSFSQHVLHVRTFQSDVLGAGTGSGSVLVQTTNLGISSYRAGSFLYNPLACSFFLLIPFGVLAARLASRVRPQDAAALAIVFAGLLMTGTRSSILAALVAGAVLLIGARGAASSARVAIAALVLLVLVAGSLGSAFRTRVGSATSGQDFSTQQHVSLTRQALHDVVENPLGRGLGTSPGIGARFGVGASVTGEDAYLQVGIETGVLGVVLFAGALVGAIGVGWRRRDELAARAVLVSGVALALSGLFLHTWEDFSVSLSYWCLAGLLMGTSPRATERNSDAWASTEVSQL